MSCVDQGGGYSRPSGDKLTVNFIVFVPTRSLRLFHLCGKNNTRNPSSFIIRLRLTAHIVRLFRKETQTWSEYTSSL